MSRNILKCSLGAILAFAIPAAFAATGNIAPLAVVDTAGGAAPADVPLRPADRAFTSPKVEECIGRVQAQLTNPKLARMFALCFPNTLDTTVKYRKLDDGDDDTFVITGDIPAMWLRDSGAQVWPYLRFAAEDEALRLLIRGVVRRQFRCLLIDTYANAFMEHPDSVSTVWGSDYTEMRPGVFERKYELDSQCYPIRLAYAYWKKTGDATIFDALWLKTVRAVFNTMKRQQGGAARRDYEFQRRTNAMHDTQSNYGLGHPAAPCGLIVSRFRPSDDCTIFPYNIPGNLMAATALRQAAEILKEVNGDVTLAANCLKMSGEIKRDVKRYGIVRHPRYGKIYAYEVDGYGSSLLMDDANTPSLLSLPYISDVPLTDPVYRNTRRFVWSADNPYFFSGTAGEGIGSPHTSYDNIWPMSIIMYAMTSTDDAEIKQCIARLLHTDAGTCMMHESFNKDNSGKFTRSWFAWANTLFGELVLKLLDEGRLACLDEAF